MDRTILWCTAVAVMAVMTLCACTSTQVSYSEWGEEDLAAELRESGLGEETSATVAASLVQAEKTGSIDPILDLLGEDEDTALAAAALLVTSEFGSELLVKALKEERVPDPAPMVHALAFTQSKKAVDYLVHRLDSGEDEEVIERALRHACGISQRS